MTWRSFLLWNALGGISWATSVALAAYFGGKAVEHVITDVGLYALIAVAALAIVAVSAIIIRRRRITRTGAPPPAD
jgi:membrane-associated protein